MSGRRPADNTRGSFRTRIRRQRRALDAATRLAADHALVRNILALGAYRSARTIGVYCAFDGEPSLAALVAHAHRRRKSVYTPVLSRARMKFARLLPGAQMQRNPLGFAEPSAAAAVDPRSLDLVLTPLVAFDASGSRLGFGGGHYDRCFRFLRSRHGWFRPKLVGIGYAFQELAHIEPRPWDVPLWGAVTDEGIHRFRRKETG